MISRPGLCLLVLLGAVTLGAAPPRPSAAWDSVSVAPMKTSIYVGSVTLTTTDFKRDGDKFTTTYEAKVRPWFWWNESGRATITLPLAELEKLSKGGRVDFTGDGTNHKGKPRPITGYAERADDTSGKIKVRLNADGVELIFNGTYRLNAGK
jgi:hypothetical protein